MVRNALFIVLGLACSSPSATTGATDSTPVNADTVDPVLATLSTRAETIVVGRARGGAIRGGGQQLAIEVTRILKGSAGWSVIATAPAFDPPTDDAIYFVADGHVLDDGARLGFPTAWEPDITARVTAPAPATMSAATDAVAPELVTFRSARGKDWRPEQMPAVDAARVILSRVPLVGLTTDAVAPILGEPDKQTGPGGGDERWEYVRHMGELGAIFVLQVRASKVTAIDLLRTQ
jgi:hypothetical protein